jgi:hypothetical protein
MRLHIHYCIGAYSYCDFAVRVWISQGRAVSENLFPQKIFAIRISFIKFCTAQRGGRVRARKELRFKNLSVLKYLLHGETTVSPTPFALWSSPHIVYGTMRRTGASSKVKVLCECRRPPRYVLPQISVAPHAGLATPPTQIPPEAGSTRLSIEATRLHECVALTGQV